MSCNNYLLLIYFVCLIVFLLFVELYMWFVLAACAAFLATAGAARALHYSAAVGADAYPRAKPAEARAANAFFGCGA